jgi:hypothetical protein
MQIAINDLAATTTAPLDDGAADSSDELRETSTDRRAVGVRRKTAHRST